MELAQVWSRDSSVEFRNLCLDSRMIFDVKISSFISDHLLSLDWNSTRSE